MSNDGAHRREELFHELCDRPAAERSRLLAAACAGDLTLRAEVEALLDADEGSSNALNTPAWAALRSADPSIGPRHAFLPGRRIDRYEIVRLIGSGGMGSVYEAVQDNPHRTVALKIMRTAVSGEQALRRFRYEVELLGRLRHSGIAQIFDAGMHDDDGVCVAYFAMEFVPSAAPLPEYAQSHRLDTHQRLALFVHVCDAVQHGHERGVVHRDLKPGNLLVDASGQPKVIDFGVARATHLETPLTTIQTSVGQLVGTLAYMSPEQAGGDSDAVDVRSDVYSLGVVLYELLAGRRLFDLTGKPLLQAVRAICDGRPPALRSIDRSFRGDLDAIVAKALELDKQRRYASAGAFAEDIRRFLNHEPVKAHPPSAFYQFRKFARRNKALVGGCMIALVGLIIGAAFAAWKAAEATAERNRAIAEARKAQRTNAFLQAVLSGADPARRGPDVTIRQALDEAAAQVDIELAQEPDVQADVHWTVGSTYVRLLDKKKGTAHLRKSLELRRRALPSGECELADTLEALAWSLAEDPREAEQLLREALGIRQRLYGEKDGRTAMTLAAVGSALNFQQKHREGEALLREALARLGAASADDGEDGAFVLCCLGTSLAGQERYHDAEAYYRDALAMQRRCLGNEHIQIAQTLECLSGVVSKSGRDEEARALADERARILLARVGTTTCSSNGD